MKAEFEAALIRIDACYEARKWARGKTLRQAWRTCERGDWMMWLVMKCLPRKVTVGVACEEAECLALPYVPEGETRPAETLRVARLWCDGRATLNEVRDAAQSATAAANAFNFYGVRHAAYAARSVASVANAAGFAVTDAPHVANAAAYAAAYAAENAAVAARRAALRAAAEIVRATVDIEDIEEVLLDTEKQ